MPPRVAADVPEKMRPFLDLGFIKHHETGNEWVGDCLLCGGINKLYINTETGQWSCKRGRCSEEGNTYGFLQKWYWNLTQDTSTLAFRFAGADDRDWLEFAADRRVPVSVLRSTGIVYDHEMERWVLPTYNSAGSMVAFQFYDWRPHNGVRGGRRLLNLAGMPSGLWGAELLGRIAPGGSFVSEGGVVWVCEGAWDGMATREALRVADRAWDIVVAVPGNNAFKDTWAELFDGLDVILAYDHDHAGRVGVKRAFAQIGAIASRLRWVDWPEETPEGFDMRDFFSSGGDIDMLQEVIRPFTVGRTGEPLLTENEVLTARDRGRGPQGQGVNTGQGQGTGTGAVSRNGRRPPPPPSPNPDANPSNRPSLGFPGIGEGTGRPSFEEVLEVYRRYLEMDENMTLALRVLFATVLTNDLPGEPLWVHVVGPPGSGKTALLESLSKCEQVYLASRMSGTSLVSGFKAPHDPSLIPKLIGKVFVLKDFTEVLGMNKPEKDNIYSTLRGAYDGSVYREFGNGVIRSYEGRFSMLTGVTHAIYLESDATLGDRFLRFHLMRGVGAEVDMTVQRALAHFGGEQGIVEMAEIARDFLRVRVDIENVAELPRWVIGRLIHLAQVVAMLRGKVHRDLHDSIIARPDHEIGTRLAIQFAKLLRGLALVRLGEDDNDRNRERSEQASSVGGVAIIGREDYDVVVRVALDTCVGYNLDVARWVYQHPECTVAEIADGCDMSRSSIRERLDDMFELGILKKKREETSGETGRGAPVIRWSLSNKFRRHWKGSGFGVRLVNSSGERS